MSKPVRVAETMESQNSLNFIYLCSFAEKPPQPQIKEAIDAVSSGVENGAVVMKKCVQPNLNDDKSFFCLVLLLYPIFFPLNFHCNLLWRPCLWPLSAALTPIYILASTVSVMERCCNFHKSRTFSCGHWLTDHQPTLKQTFLTISLFP